MFIKWTAAVHWSRASPRAVQAAPVASQPRAADGEFGRKHFTAAAPAANFAGRQIQVRVAGALRQRQLQVKVAHGINKAHFRRRGFLQKLLNCVHRRVVSQGFCQWSAPGAAK